MIRFLTNTVVPAIKALVTRELTIYSDRIPYTFKRVPLKKLLNAFLVEASILFKPEQPWGKPTNIMIEPANICNLRCTLCPVTTGLNRPPGTMELPLFRKLIDEIGDYLFTLLLWDWGEPFLNPSIYDMISYARIKGIKVITSTNGHLFSRKEEADRLVRSGLDSIIFAVDGISQETYKQYRQGGSLETALQGIRNVLASKAAQGVETPVVNFRFIIMRHNEHEVPLLKPLAEELGVDVLTLKTLNPYSQNPYAGETSPENRRVMEFLPKDGRYRRFFYDKTGNRIRLRKNPCRHLWSMPTVHWNGNVNPCTYDPQDKKVLGSVAQQSFSSVWSGAPYRAMRREFRNDWEKIDFCTECSYAYKGGNCSRETMAEAVYFRNSLKDQKHYLKRDAV